ncbi:hypothetical protein [Rhizobium leguminosarum]|uniref:hypothetical protein n=1 Tax=Rhizobium leguminosarum TaxID=384 RepID=UPI001C94EA6E|nr:hypothetical protein [Rhizobium leguminosarum]MBY5465271.1 hypothetical protein [Rhizobium leguminosarum]MBY5917338.1 hypothetical protein [Rhizobium leguminosarum]
MGWFSGDKEFEKYQAEQRMLDKASPQEYVAYFIGINTKAIVNELRVIRWVLYAILIMLITFAGHYLPDGWWYKGWW